MPALIIVIDDYAVLTDMGQGAIRSQMDVRIFLIAAAEHDTPKRALVYLLTDETVEAAVTYCADLHPPLDAVSQQAIEDQDSSPERTVVPPDPDAMTSDGGGDGPETLLWLALMLAPEDGTTVPDLMTATGMSRPWIYLPPTRPRRARPSHLKEQVLGSYLPCT